MTPYRRTVRQLDDGSYAVAGKSEYISLGDYAQDPLVDIRSFLILQKEYLNLLDYIEPNSSNMSVYSLKIRDLLIRICTEIESNFKSIMRENTYTLVPEKNWSMKDYQRVNASHFLSDYEVFSPYWKGSGSVRRPFSDWSGAGLKNLPWYTAYNKAKHSRSTNLHYASLHNLSEAISGLEVLMSAQFYTETFTGSDYLIASSGPTLFENAIGEYFSVRFPSIPSKDRYSFDTSDIRKPGFIRKYNYDSVVI